MKKRFTRLLFCAVLLSAVQPACAEIVGHAFIIDGDSLQIDRQIIRLYGIDAPEGRQQCQLDGQPYPCGQKAAALLKNLTSHKTIRCEEKDRDQYERIIAECFIGKRSLNAAMVKQGWALAYRRYGRDYIALEDVAHANKIGLWAGEFQKPWEYRHQNPVRHR